MTDNQANVLNLKMVNDQSFGRAPSLFGRVSASDYRKAVSRTILEIKAEHHLTDEKLAERLGCSKGTVQNAEHERGNLDPVTMLNLAAVFGGERRISRILALINGSPDEPETTVEKRRRLIRELSALEDAR